MGKGARTGACGAALAGRGDVAYREVAELKCFQKRINVCLLTTTAREEVQLSCLAGETSEDGMRLRRRVSDCIWERNKGLQTGEP